MDDRVTRTLRVGSGVGGFYCCCALRVSVPNVNARERAECECVADAEMHGGRGVAVQRRANAAAACPRCIDGVES